MIPAWAHLAVALAIAMIAFGIGQISPGPAFRSWRFSQRRGRDIPSSSGESLADPAEPGLL
jgi:hypothetical protein